MTMESALSRCRSGRGCLAVILMTVAGIPSVWLVLGCGVAAAQDSSLLQRDDLLNGSPPALDDSSFIYKELEPPKVLKLRDIVTVVVNINTRVLSEGEVDNRKQASLDAVLADWISFDNGDLVPDPQRRGNPRVGGKWNTRYRAEGDLETRDMLTFTIAATVVDILPNGNLVIEARRTIQNNDEVWEQSLTGVIRREDVSLDNRVESEDVAEMRVHKREAGQVRDAYRRGWFVKFFDKLQPI